MKYYLIGFSGNIEVGAGMTGLATGFLPRWCPQALWLWFVELVGRRRLGTVS